MQSTPFRLASKYEAGIVNAYFALVIRYGDQYERYSFQDLIKVEPLPGDDIEVRLRNLEYDLTRAIKKVVYGFQATGDLFDRIEEPVTLIAVVSPSTLPEMFAEVPDALRKAAEELGQAAGDKFVYRELDPATDEAARSEAEMEWGLSPMSLGLFSDQSFYLYGLLEVGGRLEQLVLTDEGISPPASIREAVENTLRRNTPGFLKTVGVVTSDPPMQIPPADPHADAAAPAGCRRSSRRSSATWSRTTRSRAFRWMPRAESPRMWTCCSCSSRRIWGINRSTTWTST